MVRTETGRRPLVSPARLTPAEARSQCPLVVLAGPTGSGKSTLALEIAEAFGGIVINADAMQVYRDLRILTARPTPADEARARHRLYGILAADDPCSAGRWLTLAEEALKDAWAEDRLPIVVGGSGLYLKALTEGLAPVPAVPAPIRKAARQRLQAIGGVAFRQELASLDAEAAARLPAGDRQRLLRAYEVVRATGRPLAEWQRQPAAPIARHVLQIVLAPPRELLYPVLDARFDGMIEGGGLDEVATVRNLDPTLPVMKAVGVPQLLAHLRGEIDLGHACADAKRETRRYAKRQLTWLRHQLRADLTLTEQFSESLGSNLFSFIRRFLLTTEA